MMTGAGLAEAIRVAMGFPLPISSQLTGWGKGVIEHIQNNAEVDHASGDISGTCPPTGGPLTAGSGANGIISAMIAADMATEVKNEAGYPSVSSELTAFCEEVVDHIELFGVCTFNSGDITGTCTNTAISPGPLTAGTGVDGVISGLNGDTLADAVHASIGYPGSTSPELKLFCGAVTDYVEANGVVGYASGSVTGTCPAGGGPLTLGIGTGGTIS